MTEAQGYDEDLGYQDAPYSPALSPLALPPMVAAAPPLDHPTMPAPEEHDDDAAPA